MSTMLLDRQFILSGRSFEGCGIFKISWMAHVGRMRRLPLHRREDKDTKTTWYTPNCYFYCCCCGPQKEYFSPGPQFSTLGHLRESGLGPLLHCATPRTTATRTHLPGLERGNAQSEEVGTWRTLTHGLEARESKRRRAEAELYAATQHPRPHYQYDAPMAFIAASVLSLVGSSFLRWPANSRLIWRWMCTSQST